MESGMRCVYTYMAYSGFRKGGIDLNEVGLP